MIAIDSKAAIEKRFEEGLARASAQQNMTTAAPVTINSSPWAIGSQIYKSSTVITPGSAPENSELKDSPAQNPEKVTQNPPKPSIIELANNTDYSIETIAKEAKRINEREGEVFISLH